MEYINRTIDDKIHYGFTQERVVLIFGARRVGKTTSCMRYLEKTGGVIKRYYGEDAKTRELFATLSLETYQLAFGNASMLFIDEAQYIPDIGTALKLIHDAMPEIKVLATGSSAFGLASRTSESLTGRKYTIALHPITIDEILIQRDTTPLVGDIGLLDPISGFSEYMRFGTYPRVLLAETENDKARQLNELADTYLYKDILQYQKIRKPDLVRKLATLIALQVGQLCSTSNLAKELSVDRDTVERYLQILEDSYIIFSLPALYSNQRKEVVKSKKYFFWDTGIRNAIIGNFSTFDLRNDVGGVFENFVISELIKYATYHSPLSSFHFWRTYTRMEIDLIQTQNQRHKLYQIRHSARGRSDAAMKSFSSLMPVESKSIITKDNFLTIYQSERKSVEAKNKSKITALHPEIKKYLEDFDSENKSVSENGIIEISVAIEKIYKQDKSYKTSIEDEAEHTAFYFNNEMSESENGWGCYYGPYAILRNDSGQLVEYPSKKKINARMLQYWKKRADETRNPILQSRYADLVIDFQKNLFKEPVDIQLCRTVIDACIDISKKNNLHPYLIKTKIRRALSLALSIKDRERQTHVKNAMLSFERRIDPEDTPEDKPEDIPGYWGFSFKWLYLDQDSSILTSDEITLLADKLLSKIDTYSKKLDFTYLYNAVELLAKHYSKIGDEANLIRVICTLETVINTQLEQKLIKSLQALVDYEAILTICYYYLSKNHPKLKEVRDRIIGKIGSLNTQLKDEAKSVTHSFDIPRKEIEAINEELLSGDSLKNKLLKIAVNFLPSESHDASVCLHYCISALKKAHTAEEASACIQNTTAFKYENQDFINRSVAAYWQKDYFVSSHLFIPLIESGIRNMLRQAGATTMKENSNGGFSAISLHALLHTYGKFFNAKLKGHTLSINYFFKMVLIENLGLNLRNDFAHGIEREKFSACWISDRLFQVILCLCALEK